MAKRDDIERLQNLLQTLADHILTMTDEEVAEELADLEPMIPSVREIIERALAKHSPNDTEGA